MKKSEYIEKVLEQVRCKSVHEPLKKELEAHIDDQAEAFISVGLPEAEAEEEAVKTMGDAVDTGVRLDSAHRPRFPMSAAVVAMLLMAVGLVTRTFVLKNFYDYNENSFYSAISVPLAAAAMLAGYFLDYTVFTKFPKIAYSVFFCALTGLCILRRLNLITGVGYDRYAARRTLFFGVMLLTPFICGFVWSMRDKGFGGFVISCLVSVIPAALAALCTHCISAAILAGTSALMIMTYAVKNNFFHVRKITAYLFMYIPALIAALLLFVIRIYFPYKDYFIFSDSRYIFTIFTLNWGFPLELSEIRLFGANWVQGSVNSAITEPEKHMIMAVTVRHGWAAGIAMSLLLLLLPALMLVKSAKITNVFGRLTSFSISFVFLFLTVTYILLNLGIPTDITSITVPLFMAASPLNAIACGALLGIFMSAYGKKDTFPERKIEARRNAAV